MGTRAVVLSGLRAAACATVITAVSAWGFVNSTACSERDPFQFASVMTANAKMRAAKAAGSQADHPVEEVPVYTPLDLLAPSPACLGSCA